MPFGRPSRSCWKKSSQFLPVPPSGSCAGKKFAAELLFLGRAPVREVKKDRGHQIRLHPVYVPTSVKVARLRLRSHETAVYIDRSTSGEPQQTHREEQARQQTPPARRLPILLLELLPIRRMYPGRKYPVASLFWYHCLP